MFKDLSLNSKNYIALAGIMAGSILLFFSCQIFAVILLVIVFKLFGKNTTQVEKLMADNSYVQGVLTAVVAVLVVYSIVAILRFIKQKPRKFLLLQNTPSFKQLGDVAITYGVYFVTLAVVVVAINIINTTFFPNAPLIDTNQAQDLGVASAAGWGLLPIFVMLVVIPPIYEEIMFRGFLFQMLKRRSSVIIAGILTSALFGIAHLEFNNLNWIAAIDTLIFSGFLIYISQKHKSLYSSMFLHAIKNSIAFYVLFVR